MPDTTHTEHEDHPWTIDIPDHPTRADSPEYVTSRAKMNQLAGTVDSLLYGVKPWQDHHGGGLWLKDADGWFLVRNLAGIEWSAQFCADPAKVDELRVNARRLYAAFPDAVDELGIRELLDTPITDADGIAAWTDSICNASVPLPAAVHTAVFPNQPEGGVHHYPTPITDIELLKRDDFNLWVEVKGVVAAVVPTGPIHAGIASEEEAPGLVLYAAAPTPKGAAATEGPLAQIVAAGGGPKAEIGAAAESEPTPDAHRRGGPVLPPDNPFVKAAFGRS